MPVYGRFNHERRAIHLAPDRCPALVRTQGAIERQLEAIEGDIEPTEVKAKMDRGDQFVLIDVREPHEYQICSIPNAKLIPLGDLPKRVNELDSADEIVAHCKSGMRSAKAVEFLKQAGFKKVRNMKGGILAWSDKVDPTVPKY